ncbi:hypothetical protein F5Y16DRAFT_398779 [Xylariaceae sp. FL0255]|nr:hypothetical protein F5Y16DRAFT_398779 [Xylariaceae sp. FL0255]
MTSQLTPSARVNFDTSVVFLALSTVTVGLRFYSRLSVGQQLAGPDWTCLMALLSFCGYCIVIYNFIWNVSLFHALDFKASYPLSETKNFLIAVFILEILFTIVITSVKLSILWFYYNLFSVNRIIKRVIFGLGIVCIIWFFVALLPLIIFQCHPVDALWNDFDATSFCLPSEKVLLGYELSNFFIDVAILSVPVATVGQLKLSRTKKIGASVTFLLGGFVCIASIVRLTTIYDVADPSRPVNSTQSLVWSTVQAGAAIICCCIPTYGPLFARLSKPIEYLTSRYGSRGYSDQSKISGASSHGRFQDLSRNTGGESWTKVGSADQWYPSSNKSNEHILQPLPPKGIVVSRKFEVV